MRINAEGLEHRDFSEAFESLRIFPAGPLTGQAVEVGCRAHGARFVLGCDLSPLFPYINAVATNAQYYAKPDYIKFILDGRLCAFYPDQGAFTPVRDMAEAMAFLPALLDFIRNVDRRRREIVPSHKRFQPASAIDIYRLLPGSNCGECGFATCIAYAAALSRQRTSMAGCPYLGPPMEEKATFPVMDRQGNIVRTVSLAIDTTGLRERIGRGEAHIRSLQSKLSATRRDRQETIEAANRRLPTPLTRREIQVLRRLTRGATNREISAALNISPHTVKSHVIHIFNKIGVNDRAQAAAWGARHGML